METLEVTLSGSAVVCTSAGLAGKPNLRVRNRRTRMELWSIEAARDRAGTRRGIGLTTIVDDVTPHIQE